VLFQEPCDDSLSVNDDVLHNTADPLIGVVTIEHEFIDTISVTSAEENILNWSNEFPEGHSSHGEIHHNHLQRPLCNQTTLDKRLDLSTDLGDTTEDDEGLFLQSKVTFSWLTVFINISSSEQQFGIH